MWKKLAAIFTTILLTMAMAVPVLAGDMYRFYNPNSGEHFYSADYNEGCNLTKAGWKYEGIGWVAPDKSKTPVYRLYNPYSGDHHFTIDAGEKNSLVKAGWKYEGIGWYSDDSKKIPMYRQYNPNAKTGSHNFTTSMAENNMLASVGWRPEGIAWYASAPGRAGTEVKFPAAVKPAAPARPAGGNKSGGSRASSGTKSTTGTVYWTPSGDCYHKSQSCRTLRRSRTILSGPVSSAGGRRPCKVCF